MTLADLHQEIVDKARAAGLRQCDGAAWRDEFGGKTCMLADVYACCEIGLLTYASRVGWITDAQRLTLHSALGDRVAERNDRGWGWDDFTEALRRGDARKENSGIT